MLKLEVLNLLLQQQKNKQKNNTIMTAFMGSSDVFQLPSKGVTLASVGNFGHTSVKRLFSL